MNRSISDQWYLTIYRSTMYIKIINSLKLVINYMEDVRV